MSERERAYKYLLHLLSIRPRTEEEARRKLRGKGFSSEAIEDVIARAKEEKLLDDRLFARLYAEDRAFRRPRAKRLIEQELARKGIPSELVREAIDRALGEVEDADLAREALRRRLPALEGLPREAALRRAFSYLLRRGFPPGIAREVVQELLGSGGPEEGRDGNTGGLGD